jgi:hypothetical protein
MYDDVKVLSWKPKMIVLDKDGENDRGKRAK